MHKRRRVDVMISPNMTSFSRVITGRRWFPFHRPASRKTPGQVKLVFESSKVIPENKVTSKTEYTNTQQD